MSFKVSIIDNFEIIDSDRNKLSAEFPFLKDLFEHLSERGVKYCVLRNFEDLPISLNGSDLDILVSKETVDCFYSVILDVLKMHNGRCVSKYGSHAKKICLIGEGTPQWWGVEVDIFEGSLTANSIEFLDSSFVINRSNLNKYGVRCANDQDAAIIAFLKELLNNFDCRSSTIEKARYSYQSYADVIKQQLTNVFGARFKLLSGYLCDDDCDHSDLKILGRECKKSLSRKLFLDYRTILIKVRSLCEKLYRLFKPPGFVVAVVGCDGSGKSTLIESILPPLKNALHNKVYVEHLRPNLLPPLSILFRKKGLDETENLSPHKSKPSGTVGSLIRLSYYFFDYIIGYWFKVYPSIARTSSLWIFDRYFYDHMIDPVRSRISLPQSIVRIFEFFVPTPSLIFCLGTTPEEIYSRKPELTMQEITRQVNLLKEFSASHPRAFWVDTGGPIELTVDLILREIADQMSGRY